jgi:hypothetical protein
MYTYAAQIEDNDGTVDLITTVNTFPGNVTMEQDGGYYRFQLPMSFAPGKCIGIAQNRDHGYRVTFSCDDACASLESFSIADGEPKPGGLVRCQIIIIANP